MSILADQLASIDQLARGAVALKEAATLQALKLKGICPLMAITGNRCQFVVRSLDPHHVEHFYIDGELMFIFRTQCMKATIQWGTDTQVLHQTTTLGKETT